MPIEERIQKIQETFQIGRAEGELRGLQATYNFESELAPELISVAMEGCSMAIALISLKEHQSLSVWEEFVKDKGANYLSQIHVGLGWALAELQLPVQQYISTLDAKWQLRVLDGYGYYSGLFKRRESVRNMLIPTQIPSEMQAGFDQGLGRVLFYLSNGDLDRLERNIALFPDSRHSDFWRGIGIAVTFIGCEDKEMTQKIYSISGKHSSQFSLGVAIAGISIKKANTVNHYSLMIQSEILKHYPNLEQNVADLEEKNDISFSGYLDLLIKI